MAVLEVKNPFSGETEKVNFSGDEPTQDEMNSLFNFFQKESGVTKPEIDLTTATSEEIRDFIRTQKSIGVDPITGEEIDPQDFSIVTGKQIK